MTIILIKTPLVFLKRCQWYIKAKMKSEEKRRTQLQNGDCKWFKTVLHNIYIMF